MQAVDVLRTEPMELLVFDVQMLETSEIVLAHALTTKPEGVFVTARNPDAQSKPSASWWLTAPGESSRAHRSSCNSPRSAGSSQG